MSNLNMEKLNTLKSKVKHYLTVSSSNQDKNIKKEMSELFNNLSYAGEILERFEEQQIFNPEALTLAALEGLTNPGAEVWDNQSSNFLNLIKKNKLDNYHLLKIVASMLWNTHHENKINILEDYKKLNDAEKIFLLEKIIFTKTKGSGSSNARTILYVRKKLSLESFFNFEEYINELEEDNIEKYYLTTLLIFGNKKYKKVDTLFKGKKELHEMKEADLSLLKDSLNLTINELYFISFLTQSLFEDLSKVKTYRLVYNLFAFKDNKLINYIFYLDKKYKINLKMSEANKYSEFMRTLLNKNENALDNILFFIFMDFIRDLIYKVKDISTFKNLLEPETFKLFKENNLFNGLVLFFKYLEGNIGVKEFVFEEEIKKFNEIELGYIEDIIYQSYLVDETIYIELFNVLYQKDMLKEENLNNFKNILKENNCEEEFLQKMSKKLVNKKYLYDLGQFILGEEYKDYLIKEILHFNFDSLLKIKDVKITSQIILDTLNYIENKNLSYLESFIIFLYKNKSIMNESIYKNVNDAIIYIYKLDKDNYKMINQLFTIEENKVEEYIRKNSSFLSYSTNYKNEKDSIDIMIESFKMIKNKKIINELIDVILNAPYSYRIKDTSTDFYYFIKNISEMNTVKKSQKDAIMKKYFYLLIEENHALKRKNKEEIMDLINYL